MLPNEYNVAVTPNKVSLDLSSNPRVICMQQDQITLELMFLIRSHTKS